MHSYKQLFWILGILFTLLGVVLAEEETEIRGEGEDYGEYIWQKRLSALVIFTIIVFLSILFEIGREKIEETTSEEFKPVAEQLFQGSIIKN